MIKWIRRLISLTGLLVIAGCISDSQSYPEKTVNVLFIGNSFTFMNDMPEIFASLAEAGEHDVIVESIAKPGYSLHDHALNEETINTIQEDNWDYVILQEKSSLPVLDRDLMYLGISELIQYIAPQGAETVIFLPWAYRNGFSKAGLENYESMQAQVTETYLDLADDFVVTIAPVGIAWQSVQNRDPGFDLWSHDGQHPSPSGSYLAAATFYALIFQEYPADWDLDDSFPFHVEEGKMIADITAETVLGSPGKWDQ